MDIGLIANVIDGKRTGVGNYTYNLIKNLLKIDNENSYTLIHNIQSSDEIYKDDEELIIKYPDIPFRITVGNNIVTARKISQSSFDIVHDPSQISPFLFRSDFKKVLTIHDLTPIIFPETHSVIHSLQQRLILPKTLKNIDKIVVVSRNTQLDVINHLKVEEEKTELIYCGRDERFKPIKDEHELERIRKKYNLPSKFILDVSTLEPRKNISRLIEAFYQLKTKVHISHKLVIVGRKGWKSKEIFNTIKRLNFQNEVMLTDYLNDEDLPIVYNLADMLVYPSIYEGFGLPPLEAMASGCPVIASNTSSLPEVVSDAGILINPYNIDEIANAMYEVLNDDCLRENMIKKGLKRANLFSWDKTAKETIKLYNQLV